MPAWLALPLTIVPILLIAYYGSRRIRDAERTRRIGTVPSGWLPARGVVVDEHLHESTRRSDDRVERLHRPVITFQSADGREVTFTSRLQAVGMPRPGALIGVYHDPDDPTRACIAPESLPEVVAPLRTPAKLLLGFVWALAAFTIGVLAVVFVKM